MTHSADYNDIPPLHDDETTFLGKFSQRITGIVILLICIGLCLSLASWNVEDPSLTHATDKPVTNWLGFFGASLSDMLIQFFGLGAAALAFLPLIWGYQFLKQKLSILTGQKFLFFFSIVLLTSALASLLPAPPSWPMPTGLGGLAGNLFLSIPANFISEMTSLLKLIFALLFFAPIPFLFLKTFHISDKKADAKSTKNTHNIKIARNAQTDDFTDEKEEKEENAFLAMVMGATSHIFYSGKARIKTLLMTEKQKMRLEHVPAHDLTMSDDENETIAIRAVSFIKSMKRKLIDDAVADDGLNDYLNDLNDQHKKEAEPIISQDPITVTQEKETFSQKPLKQATPIQDDEKQGKSSLLRVGKAALKTMPGKRILKETQPSLPVFDNESDFELPPLHLLAEAPADQGNKGLSNDILAQNAHLLEGVLDDFGVKGEIVHVRPGPVVTLYELEPAPGIKSSRVIGLADDIARSMSAIAARVAVIPGKNAIGIELPNAKRETVYLHESLASNTFEKHKGKLPICLGKTIGGESVIADLARMPHLLVAGTTGSGKSVAINTMILSLLFRMTPEECKLIMIDPKMLELSIYDGIPHLLTPVVTDPKKAVVALKWTVREMEDRYRKMSKVGVRNIDGFNTRVRQATEKDEPIVRTIQTGYDAETGEALYESEELDLSPLPYIVVIIDEMADLMMVAGKDIEGAIQRLAQMARAAGIHVIMATQRPSVDVITGTIKANFPTRISFQVTSKIDSRTILGEQGAEQLLGMGDMLYMAGGGRIQRVHGPFVADEEVEDIVNHLKDQGIPQYLGAVTEEVEEEGSEEEGTTSGNVSDKADPYDQAVAIVLRDKKASTSYIQRRLGIGYNRAATLIERMEEEGVIGPANHAGKREILVGSDPEDDFNFKE